MSISLCALISVKMVHNLGYIHLDASDLMCESSLFANQCPKTLLKDVSCEKLLRDFKMPTIFGYINFHKINL